MWLWIYWALISAIFYYLVWTIFYGLKLLTVEHFPGSPGDEHGAITQDMNVVAYDGSEADTEWSDGAGEESQTDHTTDTLTASDIEKDHSSFYITKVRGQRSEVSREDIMSMKPKSHRRSHTVGHTAMTTQRRSDPADRILDKIDMELYKISQPILLEKCSTLSRDERDSLRLQGVEFDTGDETMGDKPSLQQSLAKLRGSKMFDKTPDEGDTGLGSVDDIGSDTDLNQPHHIMGKAEVYDRMQSDSSEDEEQKEGYVEIDSDCAKQLNEKYKEIMRSKKGKIKRRVRIKSYEDDKSCGVESDVSSDTESRIDLLVEQKIQEILRKVKANGDYSDLDSVRAFQGSPVFHHIQEESEEERSATPVYSRSRPSKPKKSAKRSPMTQRRTTRYDDDLDLGDEAHEIERQSAEMRKEMESEGWHSPRCLTPASRSRTPTQRGSKSPVTRSNTQIEPSSLKLRDDLSKLQLELIRTKQEQQTLNQSLDQAQEQLQDHQLEIKSAEKQVKDHRAKAEDARSELMLAEFKRDSARNEVERLQEEVKLKRSELDIFADTEDTTDGNTSTDYSKIRSLKLSRTEVAKMLGEREELKKKQESLERQYKELERQLAAAKDGMINDQKSSRQQEDALREDLESCEARLHEANTECDSLRKNVNQLETQLRKVEQDQGKVIREKCAEYDELKTSVQEQLAENKVRSSQEMSEVRSQLTEVTDRLANTTAKLNGKEDQNMKLQEQVLSLQAKLSEQVELTSTLREENILCATKLQQEKDNAVSKLQLRAEDDKNHALDELAQELEHQHNTLIAQTEHHFKQEVTDLQGQLSASELELAVLRDKLKQQESMGKLLADKIRNEANVRFRQLVQEERTKWDEEKEQELNRQLGTMREEMEKTAKQLREELAAERQIVDSQLKQIMDLKKQNRFYHKQELEGSRIQNRQAIREKLYTYNLAQETADYDANRQMDSFRERIEEENHRSVERLRDKIRRQEEELERLRRENKELTKGGHESQTALDTHDRAILNDVNDECRKIAGVLGTTPRVLTFASYNCMSSGKSGKISMKSAIGTALNNLRNSSEDLRNQVMELKQELESHKQATKAATKEKKEAVDTIKQKMQREKLRALETLKDRLIKEHLEEVDKLHKSLGKGKTMHKALRQKDGELQEIQYNMKKWKNQTTEKLATQFQEEMAHELEKRLKEYKRQEREWERDRASQHREIDRLEKELHGRSNTTGALNLSSHRMTPVYGTPVRAPPPGADSGTAKMVKQLQGKVRLLEFENTNLKHSKKLSTSTPDLQSSLANLSFCDTPKNDDHMIRQLPKKDDHMIRQLEVQLQRTENRLKLTEDRASKNDQLLNQKLLELTKLQSTLTQQTKELMQLERAYTQLQQKVLVRPSNMMFTR